MNLTGGKRDRNAPNNKRIQRTNEISTLFVIIDASLKE